MIARRLILIGLLITAFAGVTIAQDGPADPRDKELQELRATVKFLKARIEALEKTTARQRDEIAKLKEKGSPAEDPAAKRPAPANTYTYRGKKRTEQWFDKMYKTYRTQVAMIGDSYRFVDNRSNYTILRIPPDTIGAVRSGWGIVTKVIDDDEVLAKAPGNNSPTAYFHLRGVDTSTLVEGSELRWRHGFLYLGDYEHVEAGGAKRRIQSYRLHKPLTREQFAEALAGGVILKMRVEDPAGRSTFTEEE